MNQTPSLSKKELKDRAAIAKRASAALGDVVRVLMQTEEFKGLKLSDLNGLVLPAIGTGQFLTAEAQDNNSGQVAPLATVLWAQVSDEVDRRLSSNLDQPVRLSRDDWKSGVHPWLIVAAGQRPLLNQMLNKLQTETFEDRPMKVRSRDQNGQTTITTVAESFDLKEGSTEQAG